ncbi:MAG TPA: accessory gene regulator B family protein [Clostridiales bacterium]|nr:accessory gene regulator B family protein [Clostridiales bacterium]
MVSRIVLELVRRLEEEQLISREACDHYEYALITLAERVITIGTIVLIALIFRRIVPTICFLVFFLSLRKRTGGYHADEFWKCYLGTVFTYVVLMEIAVLLLKNPIFLYGVLFFSIVLIAVIGTVNHPNMGMDTDELNESKKAARLLGFLEGMIILSLTVLGLDGIYVVYMSIGVILCAILLCLAKIIKQEVKVK